MPAAILDPAGEHRTTDQRDNNSQGPTDWKLPAKRVVEIHHFQSDKHQNRSQTILDIDEAVHRAGQHEEHRSQAKDREDVRSEDNQWFLRQSEDRRDRINREDDVGKL